MNSGEANISGASRYELTVQPDDEVFAVLPLRLYDGLSIGQRKRVMGN